MIIDDEITVTRLAFALQRVENMGVFESWKRARRLIRDMARAQQEESEGQDAA